MNARQRTEAVARVVDRVSKWENEVVDIDQEYQAMLQTVRKIRVKIQSEWDPKPDWKLPKGLLDATKTLAQIFDVLTACEVRLEKSRRDRAEKMSTEELLEAAHKLVAAQDYQTRLAWIRRIIRQHRKGEKSALDERLDAPDERAETDAPTRDADVGGDGQAVRP